MLTKPVDEVDHQVHERTDSTVDCVASASVKELVEWRTTDLTKHA